MQRITVVAKQISASNLSRRLPEADGSDEIAVLAQTFNSVFGQLESAFDAQKRFIAHASHELRTPLTILEGEVSVTLQRARTEEEYRQTLRPCNGQFSACIVWTTNLLTLLILNQGLPICPCVKNFLTRCYTISRWCADSIFHATRILAHDEILFRTERSFCAGVTANL